MHTQASICRKHRVSAVFKICVLGALTLPKDAKAVCVHALKGLALPRGSHSGEIARWAHIACVPNLRQRQSFERLLLSQQPKQVVSAPLLTAARIPYVFYVCSRAYARAQRPGLPCRVSLRLAHMPRPARVRRSYRLRAALAAAPVLFAHTFGPCHLQKTCGTSGTYVRSRDACTRARHSIAGLAPLC